MTRAISEGKFLFHILKMKLSSNFADVANCFTTRVSFSKNGHELRHKKVKEFLNILENAGNGSKSPDGRYHFCYRPGFLQGKNGDFIGGRFKGAIRESFAIASKVNRYLMT